MSMRRPPERRVVGLALLALRCALGVSLRGGEFGYADGYGLRPSWRSADPEPDDQLHFLPLARADTVPFHFGTADVSLAQPRRASWPLAGDRDAAEGAWSHDLPWEPLERSQATAAPPLGSADALAPWLAGDGRVRYGAAGPERQGTGLAWSNGASPASRAMLAVLQERAARERTRSEQASAAPALAQVMASLRADEQALLALDGGQPIGPIVAAIASPEVQNYTRAALKGSFHEFPTYDYTPLQKAPQAAPTVRSVGITIGIQAVLLILMSFFYFYNKYPAEPELQGGTDVEEFYKNWESGLCDCMDEPGILLVACFCPCVRWADTMYMIGLLPYSTGAFIFFVMYCMSSYGGLFVPWASVAIWVAMALVLMACRQQLRRHFGMEHGTSSSIMEDLLFYLFCVPCAVAQEGRHVDAAEAAGHIGLAKLQHQESYQM